MLLLYELSCLDEEPQMEGPTEPTAWSSPVATRRSGMLGDDDWLPSRFRVVRWATRLCLARAGGASPIVCVSLTVTGVCVEIAGKSACGGNKYPTKTLDRARTFVLTDRPQL
jgi:hypothetical protein